MQRCRTRSIAWRQRQRLTHALTGSDGGEPCRNVLYCEDQHVPDCDRLERMGLIALVWQVQGYRGYRVTEKGARAWGFG